MQPIIEMGLTDSSPNITFTITREDGSIVDLTGSTVRFKIQDPKTGLRTNDPSGGITNLCVLSNSPATGVCTYNWNIGTDLPDIGIYKADLVIVFSTGRKETYHTRIAVTDDV